VYAVALDPAAPALFAPKSDEEKGRSEEAKAASDGKGADKTAKSKKEDAPPPRTVVSGEGFTSRTIGIPGLEAGNYRALQSAPGALYYLRGSETRGELDTLWRYDLKERKEETVVDGVSGYALTPGGKKLLYRVRNDLFVVDAKAGLKPGDGKLDLSDLRVKAVPRAEWAQMYRDGWRIVRDWFYDEKLHGVDWKALGERYGALVPFVANRADLDFIFGELLGELEAGHTYVAPGDEPKVTRVPGGMLGCEFRAEASGRYRIAKIFAGENWDEAYRSPLTEPGVDVKEGQFLLAIDGQDLATDDNPYRLLENKAGKPVVLKVAGDAAGKDAREITVRPIASEQGLFYLDWVRSRMAMADRLSGGKIGYIHLPDTAESGNRMLQKLFYAQAGKPALIIDDRYNGGGFIPDRMIEYFGRRTLAWWARRGIESARTPGFAHNGPKAMLVNSYSASGGDALPFFFRLEKLGPIIGTRTWGGLIGLSGNAALMDGGAVQVPTFRIYDRQGAWVVENEGVSPDIEVIDLPEARIAGGDPSLEKAVEVLLDTLKRGDFAEPLRPVPPALRR
jgi:tricorn protease